MKKNLGFSSFEFYFVVAVVGVIFLFGIQRYNKLAQETHRLSFELLTQNFSAAVYTYHARWIASQQMTEPNALLEVDNKEILFSGEGWPIGVDLKDSSSSKITSSGCLSLWLGLLQNAPAISVAAANSSDIYPYRLTLTGEGSCRYEWTAPDKRRFYFEYSPIKGSVNSHV